VQKGAQCFPVNQLLLASPSWPESTLQWIKTLRRNSLAFEERFQVLPFIEACSSDLGSLW